MDPVSSTALDAPNRAPVAAGGSGSFDLHVGAAQGGDRRRGSGPGGHRRRRGDESRFRRDRAPGRPRLPEPGSVDPFFGPGAAWNLSAADLGRSDAYQEYVDRFIEHSTHETGDSGDGTERFALFFGDYSMPVYDVSTADRTREVYQANYGFRGNLPAGAEIPWNDTWKAAGGNDGDLLIIDPETGRDWELYSVQGRNTTPCLTPDNLAAGFNPLADLCVGRASILSNPDGSVADFRTFEGAMQNRGMGLQKLALLVMADEVASGEIRHAVSMATYNTMFGPECSDEEAVTEAAGVSCGFYVPPATRVEWRDGPPRCGATSMEDSDESRSTTVPEGMRFALDISDDDIDAWLDRRGYPEPKRSTARVFAVALRDYGFIISQTTCAGPGITTEGTINPRTRAVWKELGIPNDESSRDLLDGLITRDRLYVVNPSDPPVVSR